MENNSEKNESKIDPEDIDKLLRFPYDQSKKEEQEQLINLKCPNCKSTKRKNVKITRSNGILGPGYHAIVDDEYFVCEECGIMFKDVQKYK